MVTLWSRYRTPLRPDQRESIALLCRSKTQRRALLRPCTTFRYGYLSLYEQNRYYRRHQQLLTFIYCHSNMVRNVVLPNINNEIACVYNAIRSFLIICLVVIKNIKASVCTETALAHLSPPNVPSKYLPGHLRISIHSIHLLLVLLRNRHDRLPDPEQITHIREAEHKKRPLISEQMIRHL